MSEDHMCRATLGHGVSKEDAKAYRKLNISMKLSHARTINILKRHPDVDSFKVIRHPKSTLAILRYPKISITMRNGFQFDYNRIDGDPAIGLNVAFRSASRIDHLHTPTKWTNRRMRRT